MKAGVSMAENTRSARLKIAHMASIVLAFVFLLFCNAVVHPQSREDQYGSPTEPVDHVNRAADVLSVLPETGGPLILFAGVALVAVGAGMILVGRRG